MRRSVGLDVAFADELAVFVELGALERDQLGRRATDRAHAEAAELLGDVEPYIALGVTLAGVGSDMHLLVRGADALAQRFQPLRGV